MRQTFKILYVVLLSSLLAVALGLAAASFTRREAPSVSVSAPKDALPEEGQNFLLLGVDEASCSSDVILIARAASDTEGGGLKLLQLPRDSYTASHGKLNSIFSAACRRARKAGQNESDAFRTAACALSDFLSSSLGLAFDGYAVVTLTDLARLVDRVGGVEVTLPKALSYDDPAQELHIDLPAGTHHLNGKQACEFVRCRNAYLTADYGRMDAQKLFMTAFLKKMKSGALSHTALLSLAVEACRFVKTDLTLGEVLSLGKRLLFADLSAFSFATVKGNSLKIGSALYEILPEKTLSDAILWLGGQDTAALDKGAFCGSSPSVLALYRTDPLYPLSPVTADKLDEEGMTIP